MLPGFLVGPAIGVAGAVLAAGAFWAWLGLVHDPGVRAAHAAEIAALTAAQQAQDRQRAAEAMDALAEASRLRDTERVAIRERIIRVPVTQACGASPALVAALAGLRRPGGAGAGAPGSAGGAAVLPAGPAAPSRAVR